LFEQDLFGKPLHTFPDHALEAIAREKALKEWHRDWKIRPIEQDNPEWSDLSHLL